jgi:NADPH:quinone reductase-like Zn-dependent oxidoreductase
MRAVRLTEPDRIEIEDLPEPAPGPGEALIHVRAAALTRDELTWPLDRLPATPSYEVSGTVDGEDVFGLLPFDRDGAAAELAVAPADVLAPKPQMLDHVHAAALPLPGLSAWQGLFDHGGLSHGERVRIAGRSGGVGHLAVQLARWAGAELVDDDADLFFDTCGDRSGTASRVVTVYDEAPGATYFVVEPNRKQLLELARLADAGVLVPQIDSTFPLADAHAAFERLAQRGKRGKVVLEVG